jgi:GNAT superfamily N-acetyltransferase
MSGAIVRALDHGEAVARIGELGEVLVDAVASGASVNFLAGFTQQEAEIFWRGQMPGLADGSRFLFVAEDKGRIVGTTVLTLAPQPNAPYRAEIGKMLVHSSARRQGLGTRMLNAADESARGMGRTLLLLDTLAGSAGERLYRSCGWISYAFGPGHSLTPAAVPAPTMFFYKQLA